MRRRKRGRNPESTMYNEVVDAAGNHHFIPTLKYLYLAESSDRSLVKIGCSYQPSWRVRALRYELCRFAKPPIPLRLLGLALGTYVDEKRLLQVAGRLGKRARRMSPEWFVWCPKLIEEIGHYFPIAPDAIIRDGVEVRAMEFQSQQESRS